MFCVLLGPIFLIPSSWVGVHVHNKYKRHRDNSVSLVRARCLRGPGYAPVARFGLKNMLCPLNSTGMISQDYFLNLLFLLTTTKNAALMCSGSINNKTIWMCI